MFGTCVRTDRRRSRPGAAATVRSAGTFKVGVRLMRHTQSKASWSMLAVGRPVHLGIVAQHHADDLVYVLGFLYRQLDRRTVQIGAEQSDAVGAVLDLVVAVAQRVIALDRHEAGHIPVDEQIAVDRAD